MSLDWESSPSPSAGRDWFFPSTSFIRSSSHSRVTPQYPRRFSSKHRLSRPYSTNTPSPRTSASYNDSNRAGIRRRVKFTSSKEKAENLVGVSVSLSADKASAENKLIGFSNRWQITIMVAILSVLLSISLSFYHLQKKCCLLFLCGCGRGRRHWPLVSPCCCCSVICIYKAKSISCR